MSVHKTLETLLQTREALREQGKKVVFTNGVFDLLHRGHVDYLAAARQYGDCLIVGINDDASVRRLKGEKRPIVPQQDRCAIIAALRAVDHVILFSEDTPENLIRALRPDVLVKGADYQIHEIVGHDIVQSYGGSVERIRLTQGRATTNLIDIILQRYGVEE